MTRNVQCLQHITHAFGPQNAARMMNADDSIHAMREGQMKWYVWTIGHIDRLNKGHTE